MKLTGTIDHLYEEVCWIKCEGVQHNFSIMNPGYMPPEVKSVFLDWGKMNPQPSEVSLHSLLQAKDPEYPASVERTEVIDPKITGFSIPLTSQKQSYALEFIWGKGKVADGRSVVSFSLK
ncbi:hypothetical protein [Metabacillus sp. FJAT-52054]|uniref:Uncharacterized protein n=1 Tax=Metabacillus sediminis TaxID=3117746 RepID=A0ABZ2NIU5_9BACI